MTPGREPRPTTRLARWGTWVSQHAGRVVAGWLVAIVLAFATALGGLGEGLFPRLTNGDISAPGESEEGFALISEGEEGGFTSYTLMLEGVDPAAPEVAAAAGRAVQSLVKIPGVAQAVNPYVVAAGPDSEAARQFFADGDPRSGGFATVVSLDGDLPREEVAAAYAAIDDVFDDLSEATNATGSQRASLRLLVDRIIDQIKVDGQRGEGIALPLSFLVMIVVFGGFVAAGIPVVGAIASIAGALASLLGFSYLMDLDATIVNVVTVLGLGLCIDYGLLFVSRFREEYAVRPDHRGAPVTRAGAQEAVAAAMATAGRTISYSAVIVAISLASLLVFDITFIRAVGAAGVSVVAVALLVALTLVPALCTLGARRILRSTGGRHRRSDSGDTGAFARLADLVHRAPWAVIAVVTALLVALAAPALGARLTSSGAALLPVGTPQRTAFEALPAHYPQLTGPEITVVTTAPRAQLDPWIAELRERPGIRSVAPPREHGDGIRSVGVRTGDGGSGATTREVTAQLRSERPPFTVWIVGQASGVEDFKAAVAARAPVAITLVVLTTLALLFLMTGSVVIPIKALVLNVLSLGATIGVTVWIFQNGHVESLLGFASVGAIEATVPVLLAAFGFGLSMDYEVFLLSRIVELHEQGEDTRAAVTLGLQRSGRIITSAALLMVIVFAGFAAAQLLVMKEMGFALALAIALDATIVRMLLVPAAMSVLGPANWWAPAPLRRLHARWGISH